MDVSKLLTQEPEPTGASYPHDDPFRQPHSYPTRYSSSSQQATFAPSYIPHLPSNGQDSEALASNSAHASDTTRQPPKTVNFQLLLPNAPQHRARLPLRVSIRPHDVTDSIITTVKNFYGLYEGEGVSFEDNNGITLIAQYENLTHNTTVHVRVSEPPPSTESRSRYGGSQSSPRKPRLEEPFQMLPPQPFSRPGSRLASKRDTSPFANGNRRSVSARAHQGTKSQTLSWHDTHHDNDASNGLSDSDHGSVSVSSSRKAKGDQLASADISVENIVEGGRRKRAKFESSELPLFIPPQVPMTASMSSASPQRRINNPNTASPAPFTNQQTFAYNNALPSPQSFGQGEWSSSGLGNGGSGHPLSAFAQGQYIRGRSSSNVVKPPRLSGGSMSGILPTPDPTIGSVISDEDVALQLMRLGDVSNYSHGRTSTSTLDESLSGKADVDSSPENSDGGDVDHKPPSHQNIQKSRSGHSHGPARKKVKGIENMMPNFESGDTSAEEDDDYKDGTFKGESDEIGPDAFGMIASQFQKPAKIRQNSTSVKSSGKPRAPSLSKSKSKSHGTIPPSPYSLPPQSRKASNASTANYQLHLGADDEDLSSKPRCQRCRKSKKGCDRQRPCQRCKDAGIGVDGCVSEDEGNGRKGRYGRHMGVPVKKDSTESEGVFEESNCDFATDYYQETMIVSDKSKKRKR